MGGEGVILMLFHLRVGGRSLRACGITRFGMGVGFLFRIRRGGGGGTLF